MFFFTAAQSRKLYRSVGREICLFVLGWNGQVLTLQKLCPVPIQIISSKIQQQHSPKNRFTDLLPMNTYWITRLSALKRLRKRRFTQHLPFWVYTFISPLTYHIFSSTYHISPFLFTSIFPLWHIILWCLTFSENQLLLQIEMQMALVGAYEYEYSDMRGLIAQNPFCAIAGYCTKKFCAIRANCTKPVLYNKPA